LDRFPSSDEPGSRDQFDTFEGDFLAAGFLWRIRAGGVFGRFGDIIEYQQAHGREKRLEEETATMTKNKSPIRILVTGGHHDPALAVIEELKKRGDFEFDWIGHRFSLRGERTESVEFRTISKQGIPFHDLRTGKLYKTGLTEWLKIPLGFLQALFILLKIRPRLVVSFGGYLAAPVVLAAFVLGIPAVTHEQTVVFGWANRLISLFARRVFVFWESSLAYFPKSKTVLTGNPIRRAVFEEKTKRFRFRNPLPVVYVTGGKQGSHLINEAVRSALSQFLEKYNLIHQTGSSEVFQDYQKINLLKGQLPKKLRDRYIVQEYFGLDEIGAVYAAAALVVGRAGANTVTELAALGKPSILIPIPWVSRQEQFRNAQILAERGAALVLPEEQLAARPLLAAIDTVLEDLPRYRKAAGEARRLIDRRASAKIAEEIVHLLD
jgi:UDP-N-acetylglucosamine--N-acetylmuramyl-(pentapeptide) pyrophosphoryl-undecaprenol N-acetylglucosamine transferase